MSQEYMGTAVGVKEPSRIRAAEKPLRRYAYMFLKRVFDIAVSAELWYLAPFLFCWRLSFIFRIQGRCFTGTKELEKARKKYGYGNSAVCT